VVKVKISITLHKKKKKRKKTEENPNEGLNADNMIRHRSYAKYIHEDNANYKSFISDINTKYKGMGLDKKHDEMTIYLKNNVTEKEGDNLSITSEAEN